jgi:hypothetical protein
MSELASESMWGTEGPTEEARGGYALLQRLRAAFYLSGPAEPRGTAAGGAGGAGKHSEAVR